MHKHVHELTIRHALVTDVAEITRIYNEAIVNTTTTFDTQAKSVEDRMDWLRNRTADHPAIVATVGGSVAGWGEIRPFGVREAYRHTVEHAIYVERAYQGQGIGSALLERLIELATQIGHHVMVALIVGGNAASVRLHDRFQFERVGVLREVGRKFDRWLDIIILQKTLHRPDSEQQ